MLCDHAWQLKYTPEDGDLVRVFYLPALEDAELYDRLTGYFKAGALTLAARGIEGLVRNAGRMRLLVGCTLDPPEIEAIERGESLRNMVDRRLGAMPLEPAGDETEALELLAWMVAGGHLEVKVAVPCDENRRPIPANGIFHEKSGVIEDRVGDRIAWTGSLNETAAGWRQNWESISVFKSWGEGSEPERVLREQANFDRLWTDQSPHVVVLDAPEAVRQDLMRFMPESDRPARLKRAEATPAQKEKPADPVTAPPEAPAPATPDLRSRVWTFIARAPSLPGGGELVGEATAAVTPWPHQVRAFERLYTGWPPRLLIADEVGLGKTIQAGMLLRQAWLAGRAKRILILAPKAVCRQWQIELREKFNLNWPIYDGQRLVRYPSPALRGRNERTVARDDWHQAPAVIVSSQLMRRKDRARELLEDAEPWDLIVADEAHHARRREAGSGRGEPRPNAMLQLLQGLESRTEGLLLLTATPMQVHPVEVWDLLSLLGLPQEWTEKAFLDFFDDVELPNPAPKALERVATLFRAVEGRFGRVSRAQAERLTGLSALQCDTVLKALRHPTSSVPRRSLETSERRAAVAIARAHTPIRRLVSRHTRKLLRRYSETGRLDAAVATRHVEDRFVSMSARERHVYEAVGSYISNTYNQAEARDRNAVGFVMTTYRRRMASSFRALSNTLQGRLDSIGDPGAVRRTDLDEDAFEDELRAENWDVDELAEKERQALAAEEGADIQNLLEQTRRLPPDSKLATLKAELSHLRDTGYAQVMVFTQYTDTMDFLREALGTDRGGPKLMCYSGRGGEAPTADGGWRVIERDEVKRRFRAGDAEVLLCTDAAAEGLNFQFCGAIVNYDMPWNPMRVEQRIGRIDRLGQQSPTIRIVNLHYEDTVETDVYRALQERIDLFETVVGRLQPILAELPRTITQEILAGRDAAADDQTASNLADRIRRRIEETEAGGFDLDAVLDEELELPARPESPVTMLDLDRVLSRPDLMPPGIDVRPLDLGNREYTLQMPGMREALRVTTDPEYYEEHSESLEFWSPGSPMFQPPEFARDENRPAEGGLCRPRTGSLRCLLDRG